MINSERGRIETLTCTAQGGPQNSFIWTKENDTSFSLMMAEISVSVADVSNGGVYACSVMNAAGIDSSQTTINGMEHLINQDTQ